MDTLLFELPGFIDRHKEALSWEFFVPKRFGQNSVGAGTKCLFTFTSRANHKNWDTRERPEKGFRIIF